MISLLNFIFKKLFNFLISFFNYNKIINFITKLIELDKYFIQYKFYQKSFNDNSDTIKYLEADTAIIIQGPIIYKDNFTLETIKLYKSNFKNTTIILSTWDDVTFKFLNNKVLNNVKVLLNTKPFYSGISNINLQILTTQSAINSIINTNIKYLVKTRTDQRIYNNKFIDICKLILNSNKNKIIVSSSNSYKNRLYSISDMFQFSTIEILRKFWNVSLQNKDNVEELKKSNELLLIPEIYLLYSYLNSQKVKIFWTDNDYYNILKNYIYIIDKINLDIFWNKYSNIINKEIFTKSYLEEFDMLDLLIINQKINENN